MVSPAWNHFNKQDGTRGECKYCKQSISIARGSLGNLKRHLMNKHPTVILESSSISEIPDKCSPISEIPDKCSPISEIPDKCSPISRSPSMEPMETENVASEEILETTVLTTSSSPIIPKLKTSEEILETVRSSTPDEKPSEGISETARSTSPSTNTPKVMSRARVSPAWNHFNKQDGTRGECKYCKQSISIARGSLGNLKRHLRNKHPTVKLERSSSMSMSQSMRPTLKEYLASEEILETARLSPSPPAIAPNVPLQSIIEMEPPADSEDNYAKTVADRLRDFPKRKRMMVKKKIDDILFEAYMEEEGE